MLISRSIVRLECLELDLSFRKMDEYDYFCDSDFDCETTSVTLKLCQCIEMVVMRAPHLKELKLTTVHSMIPNDLCLTSQSLQHLEIGEDSRDDGDASRFCLRQLKCPKLMSVKIKVPRQGSSFKPYLTREKSNFQALSKVHLTISKAHSWRR